MTSSAASPARSAPATRWTILIQAPLRSGRLRRCRLGLVHRIDHDAEGAPRDLAVAKQDGEELLDHVDGDGEADAVGVGRGSRR